MKVVAINPDGSLELAASQEKRMAEQKPSLGRVVLFHEEGGPYASTVTAINPDGTVELVTFGRNSVYFQHGVKEFTADPLALTRPSPTKGTWSWPPRV